MDIFTSQGQVVQASIDAYDEDGTAQVSIARPDSEKVDFQDMSLVKGSSWGVGDFYTSSSETPVPGYLEADQYKKTLAGTESGSDYPSLPEDYTIICLKTPPPDDAKSGGTMSRTALSLLRLQMGEDGKEMSITYTQGEEVDASNYSLDHIETTYDDTYSVDRRRLAADWSTGLTFKPKIYDPHGYRLFSASGGPLGVVSIELSDGVCYENADYLLFMSEKCKDGRPVTSVLVPLKEAKGEVKG